MKTAVITGASGFIGKALTKKLLELGVEVFAVVRDKNNLIDLKSNFLNIIELDMKDYNKIHLYVKEQVDNIFYLSWSGGISNKSFKDIELQMPNLVYFVDFCINIRNNKLTKKLIFIGSDRKAKFHNNKYEDIVDCVYGKVKESCETIGKNILFDSDILFNSAAFSNVFGVGDYSLRSTNTILRKLLNNENIDLIDADTLYDWLYIDDAIKGILCIADEGKPYKSYYVGNKKIRTFSNIIDRAKKALNSSSNLFYGKYKEDYSVNYDYLKYEDIYTDTSFSISTDFCNSVKKTAKWIQENRIGE